MKVKINTFGGPLPEVHGDWIDLFTAEEVVMKAGDYKEISLGVEVVDGGGATKQTSTIKLEPAKIQVSGSDAVCNSLGAGPVNIYMSRQWISVLPSTTDTLP